MAVKIRMMRIGRRHRPFFRINATESRNQRDGRILEKLGHYDPIEKDRDKQVVLNIERAKYWLSVGAVPSDAVSQILLRYGIKTKHGEEKTKRRERARTRARATGNPFTKAENSAAAKAETAEPVKSTEPAKAETAEPVESTKPAKAETAEPVESTKPAETNAAAKAESPETTESGKADEGDKAEAES